MIDNIGFEPNETEGDQPAPDRLLIAPALTASLAETTLSPADGAAVALAHRLAQELDAGGDPDKLAGRLLAVLEALGMTPAARAKTVKGVPSGGSSSKLDELRARRAARVGHS